MKIVMITGSAHRSGTTACLAEQFEAGAKAAGHEIYRFDAAFKNVHPCIACEKCHRTGSCAFQDDMNELNPHLIEADAVVFVSPIYYYDINAQIKAVIDRFYANDAKLHTPKLAAMLLAMADTGMESADGALMTFRGITKFLGWKIAGTVVAKNCWTEDAVKQSDYPRQAYALGENI